MNIALLGSGGREHALCEKLLESKFSSNIICIPGNAGTSKIATNVDIDFLNFKKLIKVLKSHNIDLVIVGPEEPLVKGIVDFLNKNRIKVFGPNKYAAQLEGSKSFMKNICKANNIPTAGFKICKNKKDVRSFLSNNNLPLVVKADGLAAGKGVIICRTEREVIKYSEEIFQGKFKSSKKLVLEEFLKGQEASYFLIVDKNNYKFFGSAQDHKKVGENETGPNTGGMGAYSPAPIINLALEKKILNQIVKPTLRALKKKNKNYTGFLYVGLMIVESQPYLIEYNVRMGDPECQAILPRLKTDLIKIINFSVKNKLNKIKIKWKKLKSMNIVICSKGYPGKYKKNIAIQNIHELKDNQISIIHAGTKFVDNKLYSNGGRVLNIVSTGKSFKKIRSRILKFARKINFKNGFFRKDIGWRVIEK